MKIICVIGTRPEAIKMAPVIKILKQEFSVLTVSTGQHKELLDQTLQVFDLTVDVDLKLMKDNQKITDVLSEAVKKLSDVFLSEQPELVIGQGDTTTALAAAQASYFLQIPFAHVEAGLRTYNYENPWPEEMNRVLISKLATFHFCPTESAKDNLFKEGYTKNIFVTGNTVIDSLLAVISPKANLSEKKILCTVHRRENFGKPLKNIIAAILEIVNTHKNVEVIIPVHPNPNVKKLVYERLVHERIELCDPMDYKKFCQAMNDAYLILTDSGGVQEEAPALGKPVLVLRDFTERPEAVDAGVVKLVGTDKDTIVYETSKLLTYTEEYQAMAKGISPYGDGHASARIFKILSDYAIEEKFTKIYTGRLWGNAESASGAGSSIDYTANIRKELPLIFEKFNITSVFDAPCGDFNWMKKVIVPSDTKYIGGDIVKELIDINNRDYSNKKIEFVHFDITKNSFPNADIWICRDCFIHLSYQSILQSLKNFCESNISYLLTTTHVNHGRFNNKDIISGGFRYIDLFSEPFNFPEDVLYRFYDFNPPYKPAEMILLSKEQIQNSIEKFEERINELQFARV